MVLLVLRWTLFSVVTIGPAMLVVIYADGEVASGPIWGDAIVSVVFCLVVSAIIMLSIAPWPLIARAIPYVESSRMRFAIAWFIWVAALDIVFLISTNETIQISAAIPFVVFFILTLAPRMFDSRLIVGTFLPTHRPDSSMPSSRRLGL